MIISLIFILSLFVLKNIGNEICSIECGSAKCNYTKENFINCFCDQGFKLSSNGKSCKTDQCFGTIVEKLCGTANCNYSFFSDWSLDSGSNFNRLYVCYCDDGFLLVDNTDTPYCINTNGSTNVNRPHNNNLNWTIPILIIALIFILLLVGSIIIYCCRKFRSKPKRTHYQLIR